MQNAVNAAALLLTARAAVEFELVRVGFGLDIDVDRCKEILELGRERDIGPTFEEAVHVRAERFSRRYAERAGEDS